MKQHDKTAPKESAAKTILKRTWDHPLGKVVIITSVSLIAIASLGGAFHVFAYTVDGYKDLKRACKR